MNFVLFEPSELSDEKREFWDEWRAEAEKAAAELLHLVEAGKPVIYKTRIWSKLKRWLLENVFFGKCGYCETRFTATDYGTADHFRPKGRVTARVGNRTPLRAKDGTRHQGYYWLAYDWRNLIPCCPKCNTGGKLDYFPIDGDRVFVHSEKSSISAIDLTEKPLLLHPYCCDENHPKEHLAFSHRGYIRAVDGSKKGKTSIEVYGLRRTALREERHKSQVNAWNRFQKLQLQGASQAKCWAFLKRFREAKEEHSSAVVDYFLYEMRKQEELHRQLAGES